MMVGAQLELIKVGLLFFSLWKFLLFSDVNELRRRLIKSVISDIFD